MGHSLLDYYKAIDNASQKMLEAAQTENWDQVVHLEGACAVLIAQLRHKSRTDNLAPEERKEKTRIMQRILRADAEIRCLAEPWLNDLEQLMDSRKAACTEHAKARNTNDAPGASDRTQNAAELALPGRSRCPLEGGCGYTQ